MKVRQDSCYAWCVMVAAGVINLLTIGFLFGAIGVLTAEFNEQFEVEITASSWVGSVLTGVILCSGPIAAILVGKLGFKKVIIASILAHIMGIVISSFATKLWHLIPSFAIICGFAASCSHVATMKILTVYFDKHQHVAYPSAAAGGDVAVVGFPFLMTGLFNILEYKNAMLATAAVIFPALPLAFIFRDDVLPPKSSAKVTQEEDQKLASPDTESPLSESGESAESADSNKEDEEKHTLRDHLHLLTTSRIAVFNANCLLWNIGANIMSVLAYNFYLDNNYSETSASIAMTIYGVGGLCGSVGLGIFSTKIHVNRFYLHLVGTLVLAASQLAFPLVSFDDRIMTPMIGLFGFGYSVVCANLGSVIEHINGTRLLYLVYGYEMCAAGIGSFIGPVAGAALQARFGLKAPFYFGSACCLASIVLYVLYAIFNRDICTSVKKNAQKTSSASHLEPATQSITTSQISLAVPI